MSVILLFFKSFLSKIFSDWKILLTIVLSIVIGLVSFKIHKIQKEAEKAKQELIIEQDNNKTLRENVSGLEQINKNNELVINQLKIDKDNTIQKFKELSNNISKTNESLSNLENKIDSIKVEPTKLTPYLSKAIDGIQKERDKNIIDKKEK